MLTKTFEYAKEGDKVYSPIFGWGEILVIHEHANHPLYVRFSRNNEYEYFTLEGYHDMDKPTQSLFWDKV
jgi:hypothetical protein